MTEVTLHRIPFTGIYRYTPERAGNHAHTASNTQVSINNHRSSRLVSRYRPHWADIRAERVQALPTYDGNIYSLLSQSYRQYHRVKGSDILALLKRASRHTRHTTHALIWIDKQYFHLLYYLLYLRIHIIEKIMLVRLPYLQAEFRNNPSIVTEQKRLI